MAANLERTRLWNADLSRSDLRRAILSGADFGHANLGAADLRECVVDGTNFVGSDLTDARIDPAFIRPVG
jgi:uncharacterized protein YjbI with pentapeptide repeats